MKIDEELFVHDLLYNVLSWEKTLEAGEREGMKAEDIPRVSVKQLNIRRLLHGRRMKAATLIQNEWRGRTRSMKLDPVWLYEFSRERFQYNSSFDDTEYGDDELL